MTVILTATVGGKSRRCDGTCHHATGSACRCICDGAYHGKGAAAAAMLANDAAVSGWREGFPFEVAIPDMQTALDLNVERVQVDKPKRQKRAQRPQGAAQAALPLGGE